MVHKKYTYKDGKRFGPYYYETKRVDGHVVTTYLGTSLPKKNYLRNFIVILSFLLLIASVYFISSNITGNVSLDINTDYNFGEQITGNFGLNLLEGELVPADSIVVVNYGDFSKEFILSDLISTDKIEGDFYAQDTSISGNGLGYGIPGTVIAYPTLDFEFSLEEASEESEEISEEPSQEIQSEKETEPETESESESESESSSITGAVISDSNVISGRVSKDNDFSYDLNEGDIASLVSESVYDGDNLLDDDVISFDSNNNQVIVTTDYSVEKDGFGPDYIGEKSLSLNIDISSFGLTADNEADFIISLVYDGIIIVEASDHISVSNEISESESETSGSSGSGFVTNESIGNETTNETFINETIGNVTVFNETIFNETFVNETIVNFTESNYTVNISTVQYGAVIGKPVRWIKTVSLETNDSVNLTLEIPASAENVKISKITDEEIKEAETSEFDESDVFVSITGEVTADFELKRESFIDKIFKLFRFTGRVIEEETETQEISVEVLEEDIAVEVEYYTGAPTAIENVIDNDFKTVTVSSPEDIHYENVLVYTNISDELGVNDPSSIRIEWVENQSTIELSYFEDYTQDGNIDYVEWVAPHLSNQTFNIIVIIDAVHLDSNRTFISNIYNETYSLDGVWSETIQDSHFIRIKFEQPLNSNNDITIYPRIISGNPIINVYTINGNISLAQFNDIVNDSYNKIYLDNLTNSEDDFDLEIVGGEVQFDHIIDPTIAINGPMGDVALAPLNSETFVFVYVNDTRNSVQFMIKNTSGNNLFGPITVADGTGIGYNNTNLNFTSVAVASVNSTSFVVAWTNRTGEWRAGFNNTGGYYFSPTTTDGSIGTSAHDVSLTAFNSTLVGYCYTDFTEGDADLIRFSAINGALVGTETDVNAASIPETNLSNIFDCAAVNATTLAAFDYDAGADDDATYHLVNHAGTEIQTDLDADAAVGSSAQVAITSLDNNKYVMAWYDQADQDITIKINRTGTDSSLLNPTDIDTAAGTASRIAIATVKNTSTNLDNFVVVYYNQTGTDIVARFYNGSGTALRTPLVVEPNPSTVPMRMAAVGRNSFNGMGLCNETWIVAYTNSTNRSVVKTYWLNGTEWGGSCPVSSFPTFASFNESPANNTAYVSGASYMFNITVSNSNGTVGFEFNGTNRTITNLTGGVYNATLTDLAAGTYSYYWWSYGTGSNYNTSGLRNYVIARNSTPIVNLTISGKHSNAYTMNGSSLLLNGTLVLGDPAGNLQLYNNGTLINQGTTEVSNLTAFNIVPGVYNITVLYNQSQNYTQTAKTYNITVTPLYRTIALNDAPTESAGTGTSHIHTYTTTDGADILIAQIVTWGLGTDIIPIQVTYDSTEMNRIGQGVYNPNQITSTEIYYLVNPPIGDSLRLEVFVGDTGANAINVASFTLRNVNMTDPIENYTYTNDTRTAAVATNSTTVAYGSWLIDAIAVGTATLTPATGIVQTLNQDGGTSAAGYNASVQPGLNSMNWSWPVVAENVNHFVVAVRPELDADEYAPRVTLNAPANLSLYNLSVPIDFNWTARDDKDTSMLCNLTIGSTVNQSNIISANNTAVNRTVTGFAIGNYRWNVTCLDDAGNRGFNGTRLFSVVNLFPTNSTAVILNSTLGSNKTSENLNVMTTLIDQNNHTMNVTVRWFNGTTVHLTEMYNNSYVNGSFFNATFAHPNTTKGHNWTANITIHDGFNITSLRSNNLSILDSTPNITLISPANNSISPNISTQNFTWAMGDDDPPEFVAILAMNWSSLAVSSCNDLNFNGSIQYNIYFFPTIGESFAVSQFGSTVAFECPAYLWSARAFSTELGDFAPYFRINFTGVEPNITLNSPSNASTFSQGSSISFNWTTIDRNSTWFVNNQTLCNLTIDDAVNISNVNTTNGVMKNVSQTGFSLGSHHWNVTCIDPFGNTNYTVTRTFTMEVSNNAPYNGTAVVLNSTLGLNRTLEDLNVRTTLFDIDNHTMNVTVRWYNNSVLHLIQAYNNSYVNGSTFNATLDDGNTTKGHNWTAQLVISDPFTSFTINSSNLTIRNSLPNGTLLTPSNNSQSLNTSNQIFTFVHSDDDGDALQSALFNMTIHPSASCEEEYYNGNNVELTEVNSPFQISTPIACPTYAYIWSVSASDDPSLTIFGSFPTYHTINFESDVAPAVTLNAPANASNISFGTIVNFNWTATDFHSSSMLCNLTIDSVINRTNIVSPNNTATNVTVSDFTAGLHNWNVSCLDTTGSRGNSVTRQFRINNLPYNGTAVVLNSTLGLNRTLEDLNVRTTLFDIDNHTMNVTVRWYNNSVLHLIQAYNNSYVNGSTFNATLDDGNTTKHHNWTAQLVITDPFGSFTVNSSTLMIRNTPPNVTLTSPGNASVTLNRTSQNFTWVVSDDDGDSITAEEFNLSYRSISTCVDANYNGDEPFTVGETGPNNFNLGLSGNGQLKCLIDNGDFYLWSARAYDGNDFGNFATYNRLDVQAFINIVMNISQIQFGNLGYLRYNDTTDNSPQPLIMINQGNVLVDSYIVATSLWRTVINPSQYFQFKFANTTTNGISENGTFDWINSTTVYENIPLAGTEPPLHLIDFNYIDATDSVETDINVTVPPAEGPGFRNTSIIYTIALAQTEST